MVSFYGDKKHYLLTEEECFRKNLLNLCEGSESLFEATFDLIDDIDFLFEKFFKSHIEEIKNGMFDDVIISQDELIFDKISSDKLISKVCNKAHKVKPVNIYCGLFLSPRYSSIENAIYLSPDLSLLSYIPTIKKLGTDGSIGDAVSTALFLNSHLIGVPKIEEIIKSHFERSLDKNTFMFMIAHELSHWIKDTLDDLRLTRICNNAKKAYDSGKLPLSLHIANMGEIDPYLTYYEVDAVVQEIYELYKITDKVLWDEVDYDFLSREISSMFFIGSDFMKISENVFLRWLLKVYMIMIEKGIAGKEIKKDYKDIRMRLFGWI